MCLVAECIRITAINTRRLPVSIEKINGRSDRQFSHLRVHCKLLRRRIYNQGALMVDILVQQLLGINVTERQ